MRHLPNHTAAECDAVRENKIVICWLHETCSWCGTMVNDKDLTELDDGARVCVDCCNEEFEIVDEDDFDEDEYWPGKAFLSVPNPDYFPDFG